MENLIPNSDKKVFNGVTYTLHSQTFDLKYSSTPKYTGGIAFYFPHPKDNIFYYCAKIKCSEKYFPEIYNGITYKSSSEVGEEFAFVSFLSKSIGREQRVIFYVPKKAEMTLDEVMAINLTATFGESNEPTKDQMDRLIERIGYFETAQINVLIDEVKTLLPTYNNNELVTKEYCDKNFIKINEGYLTQNLLKFYGEEKGKAYFISESDPLGYNDNYTASIIPIYVEPGERILMDPNYTTEEGERTMYVLYLGVDGKPISRPLIYYRQTIVVPENVYCIKASYRTGSRPKIQKYF